MATVNITLPKEYGYVVLSVAATFFVNTWHGFRSAAFRKASGLRTPIVTADSAAIAAASSPEAKRALYLNNCAHRAHANYVEVWPGVMAAVLISGVQYPVASAALGGVWTVGRIIYAFGYTNPDKTNGSGRVTGYIISTLALLGVSGLTAWSGYKLL